MSRILFPELRNKIIKTAQAMSDSGLTQGTSGNISLRNDEGFLITASGIAYKRMKPDHIVQMDLEGQYVGQHLPSTEWRMHLDIYKARPEAQAIVHVHSPFATALSCLRKEVPAFHYMIAVTGGVSLKVADYAGFGTAQLSEAALKALEGRSACLLANHGQICFASSVERALWLAGEVEALCHQYWAASLLGRPVTLDDAQMAYVLERFKTYGQSKLDLDQHDPATAFLPRLKPGDIYEPRKAKKDKKSKRKILSP